MQSGLEKEVKEFVLDVPVPAILDPTKQTLSQAIVVWELDFKKYITAVLPELLKKGVVKIKEEGERITLDFPKQLGLDKNNPAQTERVLTAYFRGNLPRILYSWSFRENNQSNPSSQSLYSRFVGQKAS